MTGITGGTAAPRPIGTVNWIGVRTLYMREVQRFLKIGGQTVLAPAITALLFLAVFSLALGRAVETIGGVPYLQFLAPGLAMMAIIQNAFANASSTLVVSKIQGNIVDILMPPLSPGELTFAFAMGGVTRGLMVAVVTVAAIWLFVPLSVHSVAAVIFFAAAAALALSLAGVLVGIWGDKFDNIAFITNFFITPLAFLSGTFYSVERLPDPWLSLSRIDPFFYMIDGFRYGFIGQSDGSILTGAIVLGAIDVVLWVTCYVLFARGWKLKA